MYIHPMWLLILIVFTWFMWTQNNLQYCTKKKKLIHHFWLSLVKICTVLLLLSVLFIFGLKNGRSSGGNVTVNTLSQVCKAHICFLWRYVYFPSDMFFLGLQIKLQYKSCFLNLSSPNPVNRNLYKVWVNFCHRFSILKRHSDKTVKGFDDNQDQKAPFSRADLHWELSLSLWIFGHHCILLSLCCLYLFGQCMRPATGPSLDPIALIALCARSCWTHNIACLAKQGQNQWSV